MGLDTVEFVMAVEDAFQLKIPDAKAQKMLTPRQVVDYVLACLESAQQGKVAREGWTRDRVERVIKDLMLEHFAISDFGWDQEFVRDLGVQ